MNNNLIGIILGTMVFVCLALMLVLKIKIKKEKEKEKEQKHKEDEQKYNDEVKDNIEKIKSNIAEKYNFKFIKDRYILVKKETRYVFEGFYYKTFENMSNYVIIVGEKYNNKYYCYCTSKVKGKEILLKLIFDISKKEKIVDKHTIITPEISLIDRERVGYFISSSNDLVELEFERIKYENEDK